MRDGLLPQACEGECLGWWRWNWLLWGGGDVVVGRHAFSNDTDQIYHHCTTLGITPRPWVVWVSPGRMTMIEDRDAPLCLLEVFRCLSCPFQINWNYREIMAAFALLLRFSSSFSISLHYRRPASSLSVAFIREINDNECHSPPPPSGSKVSSTAIIRCVVMSGTIVFCDSRGTSVCHGWLGQIIKSANKNWEHGELCFDCSILIVPAPLL